MSVPDYAELDSRDKPILCEVAGVLSQAGIGDGGDKAGWRTQEMILIIVIIVLKIELVKTC